VPNIASEGAAFRALLAARNQTWRLPHPGAARFSRRAADYTRRELFSSRFPFIALRPLIWLAALKHDPRKALFADSIRGWTPVFGSALSRQQRLDADWQPPNAISSCMIDRVGNGSSRADIGKFTQALDTGGIHIAIDLGRVASRLGLYELPGLRHSAGSSKGEIPAPRLSNPIRLHSWPSREIGQSFTMKDRRCPRQTRAAGSGAQSMQTLMND
jgi:hypothetical protein